MSKRKNHKDYVIRHKAINYKYSLITANVIVMDVKSSSPFLVVAELNISQMSSF